MADRSLLKIPAVLISISDFPATARPQAGLSFAPVVYEFYITEGATRFLGVFYGAFPAPEVPLQGGCVTRSEPFIQTATLLGNRAWLDANGNGLQDVGEGGISGLCVNLYDRYGNLIDRTSTDSNGYYGFNVQPGKYAVEFQRPANLRFTRTDGGDPASNSDAEPSTGRAEVIVSSDDLSVDAGLVPASGSTPTPDSVSPLPAAVVGPVRSGRLIEGHIADYFQDSCLIYAFASEEVLALLPKCHMVFHQLVGGGYMMDISEMLDVAQANQQKQGSDFDYSGNTYSADAPEKGAPASRLQVYTAYQNQSAWVYDPLYQAYLRYVDTSVYELAGVLHPDTDRLTGRQLHFENVIVVFARHEVVSPTNLDIHVEAGRSGRALIFRDGRAFGISWKTPGTHGNGNAGVHPIQFTNEDGTPFALKPGHTWVIVVTPQSPLQETSAGQWLLTFAQPAGAK